MASRAELEEEWREFQLWQKTQSLEYPDYLEWRDLQIAKDNLDTLRAFMEDLPPTSSITVAELKELLRNV